jgi:epoxyqueuosine reductase
MKKTLKAELLMSGATVVGFAHLRGALGDEIAHLETAISIGVDRTLNEDTISLLTSLQKKVVHSVKRKGYRYLCIPPDSDRIQGTFISKLYPLFTHKMAATSAGLGWIGRNGLLISPDYGPRLSLATVLTDAPIPVDVPIQFSLCGDCTLCKDFCPSDAITGREWSRYEPFVELVKIRCCSTHKKKSREVKGKPNCGLCITICPYGRKRFTHKSTHRELLAHTS